MAHVAEEHGPLDQVGRRAASRAQGDVEVAEDLGGLGGEVAPADELPLAVEGGLARDGDDAARPDLDDLRVARRRAEFGRVDAPDRACLVAHVSPPIAVARQQSTPAVAGPTTSQSAWRRGRGHQGSLRETGLGIATHAGIAVERTQAASLLDPPSANLALGPVANHLGAGQAPSVDSAPRAARVRACTPAREPASMSHLDRAALLARIRNRLSGHLDPYS